MSELPPGLQYQEDDPSVLARGFRMKTDLNAVVRGETARLVCEQHEALPRWRWLRRWAHRRVLKVLAREEEAYRASRSADR